nr:glycosyltransferase [uncultured Enterobacter sp.]
MNECALVSIVIPAYNPEFFETALSSALNQSWPNCEVIIHDDSQDDTISLICERYASRSDTPIYYTKNEIRLWEEGNVLAGVRLAKGKYVKFLYDDDIIYEHAITRLIAALESSPQNRMASSRRTRIDVHGKPLVDILATAYPFTGDAILHGPDVVKFFTDHNVNFIGEPSAVLCYRDDLLSFGDELFKLKGEHLYFLTDMTLFLKLLHLGNLAFVAEPLAAFRVSENQSSQYVHLEKYSGEVAKTYARLPQLIRELGWYAGDAESNQFVNVAPMHDKENFRKENLLSALTDSVHLSAQKFYSDSIHRWLDERRLLPAQRPLAEAYQLARSIHQTLTLFILQRGNTPEAVAATLHSVQKYAGYGLTLDPVVIDATAPVIAIHAHLATHACDWVMFVDAGETLIHSGMLMFDLALDGAAGCDALYGDEFHQMNGKIVSAAMRPDFNLDLLLSYPTEMARHWIFRTDTLLALGGFDPACQQAWQFDYIVRLIEQKGIGFAGHLPEPFVMGHPQTLATQPEEVAILTRHLHNRGYPRGTVEAPQPGLYALRYHHEQQPLVSIIIPTKDQIQILITCVTSLLEQTRYRNYELLIVDNNSETPEALQWLEGISAIDPERIRVLRYPHPFNYSAINNMAAREARGEYLVLLNNDTATLSGDWLDHLLNHGQRPEVGVVGAKLLYPTGKIQHAGVVLGLRGPADHPFIGSENTRAGFMNRLLLDQNYNVVTAACLLIRKSVYEQVGGLDEEQFKVSYNDVDLCLKVREAGYLSVWTPHAVVMHEGSVSQNKVDKATAEKKRQRFMGEQDAMYQKWLPLIANDPAYNPNLSLDDAGFQLALSNQNSWQPLHWKPLPALMAFPLPSHHAGQQRLRWPLEGLRDAGLADVQINNGAISYAEVARYAPTSLILQQQISPFATEWIARLRKILPTFTIFDLDEFLPAMPAQHPTREKFPADISTALRAMLEQADRLVVASEAMAESCAGLHHDIRVMPTCLSPHLWADLTSLRGVGKKPRVGWVGAAWANSDLEVIHKVISQLADSVDWVFLGYCPPSLRSSVAEYHAAVRPEWHAQKLASLNLDLAVLPLADNAWNRTMNASRLLEFGACGVPVICSDIASLRNDFHATRVENRAKSWRDAIEMHLRDADANRAAGYTLRAQVYQHGMLLGDNLLTQMQIWLPD